MCGGGGVLLCIGTVTQYLIFRDLLPTGSEEREVLGVGSIPVELLPPGSE